MKRFIFFLFFTLFNHMLFAQIVSYDIPEGYETEISKMDYKKIVDIAVPFVAKRYTIASVKDGTIELKDGQDMNAFNLHNLITKCVAVKNQQQWKEIVEGHFRNIFSSLDERKKIDHRNYESVKKYLTIRIYPKEFVKQRGGAASLIAKIDLEDTYSVLMLDLPGAFNAVQKEIFASWNLDTALVFKDAQKNINKQPIEKVKKTFDISGSSIEICFLGNENYAASYALDLLNNSPEFVGEWGSVIAMPNKGLVNICKISKDKPLDFVKFIQRTMSLIEKSYLQHEQPISDQYFWYYKEKFIRINVLTNSKGEINVVSPFGLTELMTIAK